MIMSKRNLLNLILLIFVFVLIALVVYEPGKDIAITPPLLTDLKAVDITHIKVKRLSPDQNEQEIEFNKTTTGWEIVKPFKLKANVFRIESILKLLSTVSFSQNNLTNLELTKFGLDKPQVTIIFNNTTIAFGHNKSLKNHRYVKIGSTLHMITDTFFYQLTAKAESYINHKLIPEKNKIKKLILPGLELEQTNGSWNISPTADNISADAVNQLISEWQLSQAFDVNKLNAKQKNKADITIYLDNKKVIQYKIENNKNNFNLINIDTGVRYIQSVVRKEKLLKLSNPNKNKE